MSEEKKEKNSSAEKNENLNTLTYEELAEKVETLKEESLRSRAELENFKKRSSIELSNALKFANTEILSSLIPIVTSLEKAINPSGEEFDPELHEAVSTVNEKGVKDNIVKSTLERGWKLNDRVVKPALVIVNKI